MPENTPQNPNSGKKARLGRGLGSLFGGALENAAQSSHAPPPSHHPFDQETTKAPQADVTLPTQAGAKSIERQSTPTQTTASAPAVGSSKPVDVATTSESSKADKKEYPLGASAHARDVTSHLTSQNIVTSQTIQKSDIQPTTQTSPQSPSLSPPHASVHPTVQTNARPISEESQIWMIGIDKIKPNTQQPRQLFTPEGLKDLTASIREKGILQPIVARRINEREFEIIAGERRWRAAQAAGLHQVPVILKKVSHQDSLELAIIENIQRENLNPIDEAEAYQHLLSDYSMTQQQVADKLGKERSSIANSLRLLSLPAEVRSMLKGNELSTGHAKVLLGLEDKDGQLKIAKQIVDEKLSVRATEKLVAKAKTELRNGPKSGDDDEKSKSSRREDISIRLVEALAGELQKLVGSKVAIDYADSKGKIAMHFYSDDQFNQMVEKLRKAWET